MEDYFEMYYTHPDEMIGAGRSKQNYAMHRQLALFEAEIRRADTIFSIDRLYRELKGIVRQNFTVNSLESLREVVKTAPPSPQRRASKTFFRTFFEYLEYLRRLADIFKERIYTVLFEFFYDTSFIRFRDMNAKKGGLVRGKEQRLSPELVMEVGELCHQLSFNIDGLESTVNNWTGLLEESEIDPNLFDDNSAHSIRQYKDCKQFQDLMRLVPDVLNKSRLSVVLARAWWYKAERIRRKLAGNPTSDNGLSSSSDMEVSSVTSKNSHQRSSMQHKASNDDPKPRKKKIESLEEMDMERTACVQKPPPPNNQKDHKSQDRSRSKKSKPLDRSRSIKKGPNTDSTREGSTEEEQPDNDQSFAKRQPKQKPDRFEENNADSKLEDPDEQKEERNREIAPSQKSDPKMNKRPKMGKPIRTPGGVFPKDEGGQQTEDEMESTEDNTNGKSDEDATNKATKMSSIQSTRKTKKKRNQGTNNKNPKSTSTNNEEHGKMPPINEGNAKGRRKPPAQTRPNDNTTLPRKYPEESTEKDTSSQMRRTEDSMEALSLEQDTESKEEDSRDQGPLSWQEKKLEKLRRKVEELIESKEMQRAALKLLTVMKDKLAQEIAKYRGSYRLRQRLLARVALLTEKAQGWKEETKLLDYQHQLIAEDLRLEMKLNGSFYRFKDLLKERIAYLNDMVQKERVGIEELMRELGTIKETADKMLYYGIPYDTDFNEFEMEFGGMAEYGPGYGHNYKYGSNGAMGGSLRPFNAYQFLRDEEFLLGRSLQSRYERSLWDALKWESVDSMSLMSPADSFSFPSRSTENADGGLDSKGRKDPGKGYRGDYDSSSESDGVDEEYASKKKPQMYDLKRDEKQAPDFVPI